MAKWQVGDKVVCLYEIVDRYALILEDMTVVETSPLRLRDCEGEVIEVKEENIFASLEEARRAVGWTETTYHRDGPVSDGWHYGN
jgi:hypothetical protein